jgi:LacI family transcriptional regulator
MTDKPTKRVAIGIDLEWQLKHHYVVISGILEHADVQGWRCDFEPFFDPDWADAQDYDGIIARAPTSLGDYARQNNMPAVNVWSDSPTDLPSVYTDRNDAGRIAADHLIERGLRRFGFLGLTRNLATKYQREGFSQTLGDQGYEYDAALITHNITDAAIWRRIHDRLSAWVDSWILPIGICAVNDLICRCLADICLRKGLRIPDDVALIGTGDTNVTCRFRKPTLTSIDQNDHRVGLEAARLLGRLMDGEQVEQKNYVVPCGGLISRQSSDVVAVEDRVVAGALRFIWDNCQKPIGVEDVAAGLPVSTRTLQRRFQTALGRSIHQEIVRARLQNAKRMLVDTDEPIKTVARESGFANGEHLAKLFARSEGVAPRIYRAERRTGR